MCPPNLHLGLNQQLSGVLYFMTLCAGFRCMCVCVCFCFVYLTCRWWDRACWCTLWSCSGLHSEAALWPGLPRWPGWRHPHTGWRWTPCCLESPGKRCWVSVTPCVNRRSKKNSTITFVSECDIVSHFIRYVLLARCTKLSGNRVPIESRRFNLIKQRKAKRNKWNLILECGTQLFVLSGLL